jgi:4-amino-4-deoxy-L-arabinose transferase-like glycosyltransferase
VRELWNDDAAFWAGALLATNPYFNRHAVDVVRDPAFLFFLAWATWGTWRLLETKGWRWAAFASVMATFSTLSRIEGALLFLALVGSYLAGSRGLSVSRRIGMVAILISAGPLCIAPLAAWLSFQIGETPDSRLPELLFVKKNLRLVVERYELYYNTLKHLEMRLPDPSYSGKLLQITRHYIPFVYLIGLVEGLFRVVYPTTLFASIAGLRTWRSVSSSFRWILGSVFALYLFLSILILFQDRWYSNRFIYAPSVILTLWAGPGVIAIWRWQRKRWHQGWRRPVSRTLALALLVSPAMMALTHKHGREKNILQAGRWLADHSPPSICLITNDPRIAFYADRQCDHIDRHEDINNMILRHGSPYIVVEATKPELSSFSPPSGYEEVQRFPGENATVVIFRNKSY